VKSFEVISEVYAFDFLFGLFFFIIVSEFVVSIAGVDVVHLAHHLVDDHLFVLVIFLEEVVVSHLAFAHLKGWCLSFNDR